MLGTEGTELLVLDKTAVCLDVDGVFKLQHE